MNIRQLMVAINSPVDTGNLTAVACEIACAILLLQYGTCLIRVQIAGGHQGGFMGDLHSTLFVVQSGKHLHRRDSSSILFPPRGSG